MKRYIEQGLGGSQAQGHLSQWSWDTALSWYVDVFTNMEVLRTPYYWIFMEASSCQHDQLLTQFPPLCPLWRMRRGEVVGLEFQASNHSLVFLVTSRHPGVTQEPTQSFLVRTKDTTIT